MNALDRFTEESGIGVVVVVAGDTGTMVTKAVLTAVELGLFSLLSEGAATAAEIRERLGLHPRGAKNFLNLLDSDDHDIDYFYESQLRGESEPVADLHYHVMEPRTLRLYVVQENARIGAPAEEEQQSEEGQ